ncbi:signal recognition particle-docking protein FtsY [Mesorhizobium sp. GR13]|uniref:signal recognition particle-docking protein FtsY n=1 Tax=Mesorhizobium sp. GR13 TaxID=2562308 RepID=UPI001484E492|nr:signal recognition particle-docking protein FtsY [Mesorhizobium sp. GR13]
MAGLLKRIFSFGKKEVVETPAEDEPLAPINWDALKELKQPEPAPEEQPQPIEIPAPEIAEPEPEVEAPAAPPVIEEPIAPPPAEPELPDEAPVEPLPPTRPEPEIAPVPVPSAPPKQPAKPKKAPKPEPVAEPAPEPIVPEPIIEGPIVDEPVAETIQIPTPPEPEPEPAPAPEPVEELPAEPQPQPVVEPTPAPSAGKVTVAKKVEAKAEPAPAPEVQPRLSWYQRLRQGLARSSRELSSNIAGIFTKRKLDEDTLQELEDVLLRADLGLETAMRVTDTLASGRYGREISDSEVRAVMATEMEKVLTPVAQALELDLSHKPHVILVVGVNGTGKTTTIGKLASKLHAGGLSVMLAAGDTFRAAAIEQLKIWGERTGSPVVSSKLGADAAGLAYDAFAKAKEAGSDVLIIDTAGRLQNKAELMAELEKIVRVLGKLDPEAPHTVLQTVDATTGQNALNQVEIFRNVAGVNGLVMTKLDGTARGGILVAIAAKHKLPVYFIGVGEQIDDLEPFSAGDFAKAIAGVG